MSRGAGREASASAFETLRRSRRRLGNPPRDFNWVQLVEEGGVEGVGDVRGGRLRDPARSRRAVPREALHEERGGVARDGAGRVRDANERRVRGGGEGAGRRRRIRNPRRAAALPEGSRPRGGRGGGRAGGGRGEVGRDARERRAESGPRPSAAATAAAAGGARRAPRRAEASREGAGPAQRASLAEEGSRFEENATSATPRTSAAASAGASEVDDGGGPGGGVAIEGRETEGGARRRARRERGDELADERVRVERAGRRERCRGAGDLVHDHTGRRRARVGGRASGAAGRGDAGGPPRPAPRCDAWTRARSRRCAEGGARGRTPRSPETAPSRGTRADPTPRGGTLPRSGRRSSSSFSDSPSTVRALFIFREPPLI